MLKLTDAPAPAIASAVAASGICGTPGFSALMIAEEDRILHAEHAADFALDRPHSIQSVTKIHLHLLMGALIEGGLVDPEERVARYLPWIGSGYAEARIVDLLDMNLANDFTEDYADPLSACYREEEALGWRLPPDGVEEPSLQSFAASISGGDLVNRSGYAQYKSVNTDVLTLIAQAVSPTPLARWIESVVDAAGYEGAFHISLSPEGLPAFSGGGCLSARDLVRFGLLIARGGKGVNGAVIGDPAFTDEAMKRSAPALSPGRSWVRYSSHLMTNGRWVGHSGYGGQMLMIDMTTGRVAVYLGVIENDSGYDEAVVTGLIRALEPILELSTDGA